MTSSDDEQSDSGSSSSSEASEASDNEETKTTEESEPPAADDKTAAKPSRDPEIFPFASFDIRTAAVVVALIAMAVFANTAKGGFAIDDKKAIIENKDLRPENPIDNIYANDYWGMPMPSKYSHKSYRPITSLTFRYDYARFQLEPKMYHVENILLFGVCCFLFTYAAARVLQVRPTLSHSQPHARSTLTAATTCRHRCGPCAITTIPCSPSTPASWRLSCLPCTRSTRRRWRTSPTAAQRCFARRRLPCLLLPCLVIFDA